MKFEDNRSITQVNEDSFNCIVFASQMSHKNIFKLIGCCLETQTPIQVSESAEYGSLANHIYRLIESQFEPFPLTHKLKFAMETANAIAYPHVGFPWPIVFRNIRPSNIVFNEQNVTKLFDFSLSVFIPDGETRVKDDERNGTVGYLPPEYLFTGDFNENFDVYSFGFSLIGLFLERRTTEVTMDELGFKKYIEDEYNKIVDGTYFGNELLMQALAELTLKCLSLSEEERQTIVDVAKQLRQMYRLTEVKIV